MIKCKKKKNGDLLNTLLFIGPHLLFFLIFTVFPFFFGIVISFTRWDMMSKPEFIWFDNYQVLFTKGNTFNIAFISGLKASLMYTVVMVPLLIAVPLFFAVLLYAIKSEKVRGVFQALLYASSILSVSTVVLTWKWILDRENGLINNWLLMDINWMGEFPYAWISIFVLSLWAGIGGNMVIFLSSISAVPKSLYEAASLDGANAIQKFFYITLPSIRFPLLYALVMGTIGGLNVYGQTALFGGPYETHSVMEYIRDYAFGSSTPMAGMASAMSVVLGLIIAVFSAIQFKMMSGRD